MRVGLASACTIVAGYRKSVSMQIYMVLSNVDMRRAVVFILLAVFFVANFVGDDGCCTARTESSPVAHMTSLIHDNQSESPLGDDCSFCFTCIRCGGFATLAIERTAVKEIETVPLVFAPYQDPHPPSPNLSNLKRPPIS